MKNMKSLTIVKIGGRIIDSPRLLTTVLNSFTGIKGHKILVHGGGSKANEYLSRLGITPQMAAGRRITDLDTLEIVQMVYAGLINKNIVVQLQSCGCPAIGLSGADGDMILATRRHSKEIDYGFAGDILKFNTKLITHFLNIGLVPAFCALTHDGQGQILNTNADTIAAEMASSLGKMFAVDLIYCFEHAGVLADVNNSTSVLSNLTESRYYKLKMQQSISAGMLPKLDTAFNALHAGVSNVYITGTEHLSHWQSPDNINGTKVTIS